MFPPLQDMYRIAPELVACLFGMLIMVVDPFVPREHKGVMGRLGLAGALGALVTVELMSRNTGAAMNGLLVVDEFSTLDRKSVV